MVGWAGFGGRDEAVDKVEEMKACTSTKHSAGIIASSIDPCLPSLLLLIQKN